MLAELSNLKAVVQKLLLLAHADEGRLNLSLQPVDLSDLVHTAVEDIEVMAPDWASALPVRLPVPMAASFHLSSNLMTWLPLFCVCQRNFYSANPVCYVVTYG